MSGMFSGSTSLTNLDLSGFDTSSVIIMNGMFHWTPSLTNLDLTGFDTSSVIDMSHMFSSASSLTNLDVSDWDVSNVNSMNSMFNNASSLTNLDVSDWDVSNVNSMNSMLWGTLALHQISLGKNFNPLIDIPILGNTPNLGTPPNNAEFAGRWRNVGVGTIDNPQGDYYFAGGFQLMRNFNGAIHADTWVWEPHMYTISYTQVGDLPATHSVDDVTTNELPWIANANVATPQSLNTTETAHGGVAGTWSFNGWTHPTIDISGTTFVMPAENVVFEGSWTFTSNTCNKWSKQPTT